MTIFHPQHHAGGVSSGAAIVRRRQRRNHRKRNGCGGQVLRLLAQGALGFRPHLGQ